jgi:mannose-6-phosphate isomerase-like protein (cupin superfamily)
MEKQKSEEHKKLWGKEEWLANTEKYCGKILTLEPGFSCSYHYHKNKDETFYVLSGLVYLNVEGKDIILKKGESLRIIPGQKHKFSSLKGTSKIIEISTYHEEDDSYREVESGKINLEGLKSKIGIK